ncbi:hypothetical protein [Sinomicrobium sp. M5D2P17]
MNRIVHKLKCRQLERYVKQKLKDVIKQTVDHAVRNETVFDIERKLKGNMIMAKKHIVFNASTHFKSLGLHKKEIAAFVDYYFAKNWENELWLYINKLEDEALLCLINVIELDEVVVYGKRKAKPVKAEITISPKTHNGKFELTAVTYIGVNGYSLGKMEIAAPIDAVTGFWHYKLESRTSISGGVSANNPLKKAKPDIELMAATVGKINFHIDRKVTTLQELFNGAIESTGAAALLKFTRFTTKDLETEQLLWSSNTLGGGVATAGLSHSISTINFTMVPLTPLDSLRRVINDTLINGRLEFLNKRGIGEDSLKVLEGKGKLYLDMLDIENKK